MGDTYYYVRKEKILIGNSNADICIPDMEKEYLVTEKEIYVRGEKEYLRLQFVRLKSEKTSWIPVIFKLLFTMK